MAKVRAAPGRLRRGIRHQRTKAKDFIDIVEGGINLHLDPTWLPPEIVNGGLGPELTEYLRPLFLSLRRAIKEKAVELVTRAESGESITNEQAWDGLNEINQDYFPKFHDALETFLEERGIGGKSDRLAIITGPVVGQTVRAIYNPQEWIADSEGKPVYQYRGGRNHLSLCFHHPPELADTAAALWEHVSQLSPETVDVFLVLLNKLVQLRYSGDTACVRMDELAEYRGVKVRGGKAGNLYDDLLRDVKLIADLRLTMVWKVDGGTLSFGKDLPEALIRIQDWEFKRGSRIRKAFTFQAGMPLEPFLGRDRSPLVGYCSRRLLGLDPHRDSLAKKIGVYWTLQAVVGATHRTFQKVRVGTILDYCGKSLNPNRPGDAVKQVFAAFRKLENIGLIPGVPSTLAPKDRDRGYFDRWLEQMITIEVNPALCRLNRVEYRKLPAPGHDEEGEY